MSARTGRRRILHEASYSKPLWAVAHSSRRPGWPRPARPPSGFATQDDAEAALGQVNTSSKPSDLKITDVRVAQLVDAPMRCPSSASTPTRGSPATARSATAGARPTRSCSRAASSARTPATWTRSSGRSSSSATTPARPAGCAASRWPAGTSPGKAFGVPVYQMLGGQFRDRVRLYADTTQSQERHGVRAPPQGADGPGHHLSSRWTSGSSSSATSRARCPCRSARPSRSAAMTMHPFTGVEITDKGIELLCRLRGRGPRGHRHGGPPLRRPLRPHRRQLLHQARPGPWRSGTWPGWRTWCRGSSAS